MYALYLDDNNAITEVGLSTIAKVVNDDGMPSIEDLTVYSEAASREAHGAVEDAVKRAVERREEAARVQN